MPTSSVVSLQWVLHAGARVPVSTFAHLPPRARPAVACPECLEPVVLKLGRIRAHHAAHPPASHCPAAHPETALHLNTKYHIADVLARATGSGAPLLTRRRCVAGNRSYGDGVSWTESVADSCPEVSDDPWASGWDEVRVECRLDSAAGHRVPDIQLLERGKVTHAIEVVVSHAVDADKAAMLHALAIPWIEVRATETLYDGPAAWRIEVPLEPEQASGGVLWRCERHRPPHDLEYAAPARHTTLAVAERPALAESIVGRRFADVYFPSGGRNRVEWRVSVRTVRGEPSRIALEREGQDVAGFVAGPGEGAEAFKARVNPLVVDAYHADIAAIARRASLVDSPMHWLKGADAASPAPPRRYPPRYEFTGSASGWKLKPGMADVRWPVAVDPRQLQDSVDAALRGRRSAIHRSLTPKEDD